MFLSPRFIIFLFFFVLINLIESKRSIEIKCIKSSVARDQGLIKYKTHRPKRFVLFPEFSNWLNDWRYLHKPKHFRYWISNYYPQYINTTIVRSYIHHIIDAINEVINNKISSTQEALSADQSNFNYNFFNYVICPSEDRSATVNDVENAETMLIYSPAVIKEYRYRAHGGMTLHHQTNAPISHIKLNLHHQFLMFQDFQYDPVVYTCNSDETKCIMDLYAIMLHETLHGFGIEHTEANITNQNFRAVMHLYPSRIMCHDDIRAIRRVYGLPVKRENIKYDDDTCRRDFPLNKLQKLMYRIHRWIHFYIFRIGSLISLIIFLMTMIYIRLKKCCCLNRDNYNSRYSIQSDYSEQSSHKQHKTAISAFLWHDDLLNN